MKNEDVRLIYETEDFEEANNMLHQGYTLLKFFHKRTETPQGEYSTVVYVLGFNWDEK